MASNELPSLDLPTLPSVELPGESANAPEAAKSAKDPAEQELEKGNKEGDDAEKTKADNEPKAGDENDAEEEEEEDVSAVLDAPLFQLPEDYRFKPYVTSEEAERMTAFLDALTDEQLRRYEAYRRTAFPKMTMKRVMGSVTGTTVPPNSIIVMSGIAKVYCGEVIETARVVQEEWKEKDKEKGQLLPKHFREAVRRLRQRAPYTVTGAPPPRGHLT